MRKAFFIFSIVLFSFCNSTYSQTDSNAANSPAKAPVKVDEYIGVQLNDLIRQVFNFNSSTTATTTPVNPYLLTYNINLRNSGWGIRLGAGYNYNQNSTDDGITKVDTKLNDMEFRLGIEKAFKLSKKWMVGVGIDGVYNSNNDHTVTTVRSTDTTVTDSKTNVVSYGGGVMGYLRYHITERVLIGTEASFYYTTGQQKQTLDITTTTFDQFGSGETIIQSNTSKTSNTVTQGVFSSPIVFYILVKF